VLKDTLLKFLKMDSLIENITGYVETRIELLKLEIKEEIAKSLSKALVYVVIVGVVMLFVLLISMAGAYKIAEYVGTSGGFTIVAVVYLLVGLLVYAFRNSITERLEQRFQEKMNKKKK
jgi:amino acid transporter